MIQRNPDKHKLKCGWAYDEETKMYAKITIYVCAGLAYQFLVIMLLPLKIPNISRFTFNHSLKILGFVILIDTQERIYLTGAV